MIGIGDSFPIEKNTITGFNYCNCFARPKWSTVQSTAAWSLLQGICRNHA